VRTSIFNLQLLHTTPGPTATMWLPVALDATASHVWLKAALPVVRSVQVTPPSVELQMSPSLPMTSSSTATRFVPVESDATEFQTWLLAGPEGVWSFHVKPALVEVHMSPASTTATRRSPVESDATDAQPQPPIPFGGPCAGPEEVRSVQVTPPSVEVQMSPPFVAATSFVPVESDATEFQPCGTVSGRPTV
jgi:hypothetical protein